MYQRLEQDLSKIEEVWRGNIKLKQREMHRLNRKYHLEEEGTLCMFVSGMLKQGIKAGGMKIHMLFASWEVPMVKHRNARRARVIFLCVN